MATTGHDGTDDLATGEPAGGVTLDDPGGDAGDALADAAAAAHTAALRLLTVRARSRAELADRLQRRGFPEAAVDDALSRLERVGLLDDEAFAAAYASGRAERGVAGSVLRRDLRGRGVPADIADRAAAEASPPETEPDRAREIAAAWLRRRQRLPHAVATRRLAGHLTRRGYPPATIERVIRDLLPPADPDTDPTP